MKLNDEKKTFSNTSETERVLGKNQFETNKGVHMFFTTESNLKSTN